MSGSLFMWFLCLREKTTTILINFFQKPKFSVKGKSCNHWLIINPTLYQNVPCQSGFSPKHCTVSAVGLVEIYIVSWMGRKHYSVVLYWLVKSLRQWIIDCLFWHYNTRIYSTACRWFQWTVCNYSNWMWIILRVTQMKYLCI